MRRREALKALAGAPLAAAAGTPPNVLFVIIDDLNNDFGGIGDLAEVRTPHLARLAARGVRFEQNYCQYPLCNPSRVSVMSGLYPTTTKVLDNVTPPRYAVPDFVTLPQHLRAHGYQTAYFGKLFHLPDAGSWRDGAPAPSREKTQQFNHWIEPVGGNTKVRENLQRMMFPKAGAAETLEDYKIAGDTIGTMRQFHAAGKPFFLAAGFHKPHVPFIAPQEMFDLYSPDRMLLPADFAPMPAWKNVPADAFRPNLDLFFEQAATKE